MFLLGEEVRAVESLAALEVIEDRVLLTDEPKRAKKRRGGITTSRFVGVSWARNRKMWKAQCMLRGVSQVLGFFDNEVTAARRYDDAARSEGKPTNFLSDEADEHGEDDKTDNCNDTGHHSSMFKEAKNASSAYPEDEKGRHGFGQARNVHVPLYQSTLEALPGKKRREANKKISAMGRNRWALGSLAEDATGYNKHDDDDDDDDGGGGNHKKPTVLIKNDDLSQYRASRKRQRRDAAAAPRRSGRNASSATDVSQQHHVHDFRSKCPICLEDFIETFEAAAAEVRIPTKDILPCNE